MPFNRQQYCSHTRQKEIKNFDLGLTEILKSTGEKMAIKKLTIKCPYIKEDGSRGYRILMYVYYNDEGQTPATIIQKTKALKVRAVEIFSDLLDQNEESKAGEKKSLFFVSVETTILDEKDYSILDFDDGNSDKIKWKLRFGDENKDYDIRPELELRIAVRCPVLPEREGGDGNPQDQIKLHFKFNDPEDGYKKETNLKNFFFLNSNYDGLDFTNDTKGELLDILFSPSRFESVDNRKNRLPRLLRFERFAPGAGDKKKHKGNNHWKVRFAPTKSFFDRQTNDKKFGLYIEHERKTDGGKDWGKTEDDATRLFPLSIAPVGVGADDPQKLKADFIAYQVYPGNEITNWLTRSRNYWRFYVRSLYEESLKDVSFTPLAAWNRFVAEPYYHSLATVKGGNPGSIVPWFEGWKKPDETKPSVWLLDYDLTDLAPSAQGDLLESQFDFKLQKVRLAKLNENGEEIENNIKENPFIEANAKLQNFLDHAGQPVGRLLRIENLSASDNGDDNESCDDEKKSEKPPVPLFSFRVLDFTAIGNSGEQQSRVGALNLHFSASKTPPANEPPKENEFEKARIIAALRGFEKIEFQAPGRPSESLIETLENEILRRCRPEIEAEVFLMLAGLSPGGQDPLPQEIANADERLPATVIIPQISETGRNFIEGEYILAAAENNRSLQNQSLALRLEKRQRGTAGSESDSNNPKVDFIVIDQSPFLIARVRAELDLVTGLNSEIGNWDDNESFWELADKGESFDLILPPQAVGEEFIKDYELFKNDAGKTMFYKFSPPAVLKLFRSSVRQNFTEAPWNIRRLLGYIKGKERGAKIENLRFELLFGLTTKIETDFLRLAELNARLGHLPSPLPKRSPLFIENLKRDETDPLTAAYKNIRCGFKQQRRKLQSRLALLYPFSTAQNERHLSLDEGVSFEFRPTREIAHPTSFNNPPAGFPKPADGGLRGGVDWGFESENIHKEVVESKTSTSGKIVAPSFTALGGSGYQKAGFANDKSTIFSNTFLGRTFFYSLQRIGRISVLWNTAKHVIIYERSVADSDQFKEKGTPNWRGRPVVRKLEEYVEILQTERNYPEFGESPKVRGFITGSKFPPQTKIKVDSKWGRDIEGGWIVPLHNPAADQTIYPRPTVHLKFSTSEESGKAQTWGKILNPEILYFYTSTDPTTTVNTDAWTAVPEVDFPFANIPVVLNAPTHAPGALDAQLPDPPRVAEGYERFTYQLDTVGQTANLLADRTEAVAEAALENVSMVRRSTLLLTDNFSNPARTQLAGLLAQGKDFRQSVESEINGLINNAENLTTDRLEQVLGVNGTIGTKLAQINNGFAAAPTNTVQIIREAQEALKKQWEKVWAQAKANTLEEIKNSSRSEQAREILLLAKRQVEAAEFALSETLREARSLADKLDESLDDFNLFIDEIAEKTQETIAAAASEIADINARIGEAQTEIEKARLRLEKERLKSELKKHILGFALTQIVEIQNRVQSLKNLVNRFTPKLWEGLENAADNFARQLLDITELLNADLENWQEWMESVEAALDEYKFALESPFNAIEDYVLKLQAEADAVSNKIEEAARNIEELAKKELAEIKEKIGATLNAVETKVKAEVFGAANAAIGNLAAEIQTIQGGLNQVLANTQKEIETAKNFVKAVLEELNNQQIELTAEIHQVMRGLTGATLANVSGVLSPFERQLREEARRLDLNLPKAEIERLGDQTLRLVRAFGKAPIAEAMKLNRERLAYYFDELKDAVDFTPATVLVNRVGQELDKLNLKTIGVRLPSRSLAEQFIAERLPQFDLREILPDFAGLSLEKLFKDVRIPPGANDAIKITHGINEQTRRAWAKTDVLLPLGKDVSLFELGAVEIRLTKAVFEAHSEIAFNADDGRVEKSVRAAISASWHLLILNQIVLTLEDCTLRYDNGGRLKFEMQPASIKLPAALKFLSDLAKSFRPGKKNGLSFELVTENSFPVGARALLSLPLPPLQTGAFAVSNLSVRSRFEVAAPRGRFYVGAGVSLSSKERPFTLTILFLGGGGWFDALAVYRPFEEGNKLSARLSIGLAAGAVFALDIGVAQGNVYFLVSLYAEFSVGGGANLRIALRVSVGGEVSILGIVTVGIDLTLEAAYESGGTLRCSGTLTVSIEICWCFTLEVNQNVEFVLAGKGDSGGASQFAPAAAPALMDAAAFEAADAFNPVEDAVERYFDTFGV